MSCSVLLALLLPLATSQDRDVFDLIGLELQTAAPGRLGQLRVTGVQRKVLESGQTTSTLGEAIGTLPGVVDFTLTPPQGTTRMFGTQFQFKLRRMNWSGSGQLTRSAGELFSMSFDFGGRRSGLRVRNFLFVARREGSTEKLRIPTIADISKELADAGVEALTDSSSTPDVESQFPAPEILKLLMELPLQSLLSAEQCRELSSATPLESGRRGRTPSRHDQHHYNIGGTTMADARLMVQLIAGEDRAIEFIGLRLREERYRRYEFEGALATAYAQAATPENKGRIGWMAVGSLGGDQGPKVNPKFLALVSDDLDAGEIVLSMDPDEARSRAEFIQNLRAESKISRGVLVLICAAVGLIAASFIAMTAARTLLF